MRYIHKFVVVVDVTNPIDKNVGSFIEERLKQAFKEMEQYTNAIQKVKTVDCFATEIKEE